MKKEVIITACFESGHRFYSARLGATVYQGFLCPGDEFKFSELLPRAWTGIAGWIYSNYARGSKIPCLKEYHENSLREFAECPACLPSRLRKYFKRS